MEVRIELEDIQGKGNNPRYGNRSPKGSRPGSRDSGTPTEKILELKREKLRKKLNYKYKDIYRSRRRFSKKRYTRKT